MFESKEIAAKKVFDSRDTSEPVTPGQTAMKTLFTEEQTKMDETVQITTPVKALFATPARESRFTDFCDSAFKKNESQPKLVGLVSPGPTAMKNTFKEAESNSTENIDPEAIQSCFETPNTSVIDFEVEEDLQKVEEIFDDVCNESYTLAGIFAEQKDKSPVKRYKNVFLGVFRSTKNFCNAPLLGATRPS